MKNLEVAQAFACNENAETAHMRSYNLKCYSYSTCIAQLIAGVYYINFTPYSSTTSRQRNLIVRVLGQSAKIIKLYNVPMGTRDLSYYVENTKA